MSEPLVIARHGNVDLSLLPALANRHGLITGATGTGKTITLQVLAERFSRVGVPVFMADVKGDLPDWPQPVSTAQSCGSDLRRWAFPTGRRRAARRRSGMWRASKGIRCARPSPTWGRCCSPDCSISMIRKRVCCNWCSRLPMTMDCCCWISRICGQWCNTSANMRKRSRPNTETSRQRRSAPFNVAC